MIPFGINCSQSVQKSRMKFTLSIKLESVKNNPTLLTGRPRRQSEARGFHMFLTIKRRHAELSLLCSDDSRYLCRCPPKRVDFRTLFLKAVRNSITINFALLPERARSTLISITGLIEWVLYTCFFMSNPTFTFYFASWRINKKTMFSWNTRLEIYEPNHFNFFHRINNNNNK